METDAADGNPLTTRIPTAAWKAQNAFHSSHKARRRRFHHRIHFFERQRFTLNTLSFGPKDGEHLNPPLGIAQASMAEVAPPELSRPQATSREN